MTRIIPMRVGTRAVALHLRTVLQDHPHACGDKQVTIWCDISHIGSSPCVWGQVAGAIWKKYGLGIIPMRVGTSHTDNRLSYLS